jgi:hypothetical protein
VRRTIDIDSGGQLLALAQLLVGAGEEIATSAHPPVRRQSPADRLPDARPERHDLVAIRPWWRLRMDVAVGRARC